jgi:hypothetical protein
MKNFGLLENQTLDEGRRVQPPKAILAGVIASAFIFGSMGAPVADAKTVKKTLTAAQKADLRKKGREWCMKNYVQGGTFIVRVEVRNDGRVVCSLKQ